MDPNESGTKSVQVNTDLFWYYPFFVSMTFITNKIHFSLEVLIGITGFDLEKLVDSLSQDILPLGLNN